MPGTGPGSPGGAMPASMTSQRRRSLARGASLFREHDETQHAFVIHTGLVKLVTVNDGGVQTFLDIRGAGEIVGSHAAIDGMSRPYWAVALTDVTVTTIDRMDELMSTEPDVAHFVLGELSRHLRDAMTRIAEQSTDDSLALVARRILQIARDPRFADLRTEERGTLVVRMPISQQELANWAGVSHRSATDSLRRLREMGLIRTSRLLIEVLDAGRLAGAAGAHESV